MIPRLHVPLKEPEDVIRHLGKQEQHWKSGRSAHALASTWARRNSFPPKVAAALNSHRTFKSAELVDAFMERQVDLGSEGRPSQTDLLAIAGLDQVLAIIAVEGKAGEPLGDFVQQWFHGGDGKEARLKGALRPAWFVARCGIAAPPSASCIGRCRLSVRPSAIERTLPCYLSIASATIKRVSPSWRVLAGSRVE